MREGSIHPSDAGSVLPVRQTVPQRVRSLHDSIEKQIHKLLGHNVADVPKRQVDFLPERHPKIFTPHVVGE
jgi:hypothetical protein